MYSKLALSIQQIQNELEISEERREILRPLIQFIQQKRTDHSDINLHFICTHNSRRSHLAQVWAQLAADYYKIPRVYCYSGGTQQTALAPQLVQTLSDQGFEIFKIADSDNPVYAIKYAANALPIIGFSKTVDHPFNPSDSFAAVLTCSEADGACPYVLGAEMRIPITYEDPKTSDGTPVQSQVYSERSLQIASEMFYVFSQLNP